MNGQQSLFGAKKYDLPLAERMRPKKLSEIEGINPAYLNESLLTLQSMILWGPPGSGKTSFARIIAEESKLKVFSLSAVMNGSAKFKEIFDLAERGERIVLIVDEIHHLNKSQQDLFLPHLENGNIVLIGSTTENPSFELRPAILSRSKVLIFKRLSDDSLKAIIKRVEKKLNYNFNFCDDGLDFICQISDGDARYLMNMLEIILDAKLKVEMNAKNLANFLPKRLSIHDKAAESHYNLISAFHKSLRGSDVNAAIYWFQRMMTVGENPLYVARRMIRFAVEDIGLADPNALLQANAAHNAYNILGSPEGELALMQAVIYLATAPKSNAGYVAYNVSKEFVEKTGSLMPPKHIINAPTKFMKEQGFFEGYIYDPDTKESFSGQNYFPDGMSRKIFFEPNDRGFEREIKKRLEYWDKLRILKNKNKL